MNFLTPLAGAIAAAIAIPSLLLLYFLKLRRREELVSSTVLWRKAIEDLQVNAPFQRLRRNLLLLLQLLVLAALVLALSQPTIPFRPSAGKSTVLLIDRSASMSARDGNEKGISRLEEAKKRAKELLSTLSSGGQAMVIAFDDRAEIVQPFTSDTSLLKNAIDSIQPTDRVTKLKLAYQLADAQSVLRSGGSADFVKPPDVWVYSDGKILDADEISIRSEVKYEKIGSDKSANVGIVALSARRNYERPTEVQIFTRLISAGPDPVQTDVQLTVDGKVQKIARVNLIPSRWTQKERDEAEKDGTVVRDSAEFTLDMPEAGVVKVEQMSKTGDVLSADDSATVIVPPPKVLSVLLVTSGGDPFLSKLLHNLSLNDPQEITPEQYEANLPTGKDVIIFDNYRPKGLPANGNFIYFGTLPTGLHLKAESADGVPLQMSEMQSVLDWKRDHPILRNLSLTKLYAQGAIILQPASESEVLVDGVKGPLIVLHREGRNIHLAVAFDPLESNWPFLVSWPMFMHNALQYLATTSDLSVRETYPPGATPRLPRTNLAGISKVTITGPEFSKTIDIPPEGDVALPALEHVGVYDLSPPVPGFEKLAVNLLDNNESDITPAGSPPGGIGQTIETTTSKARLELWWWLVLAGALPLLLVEWFVYTRRTHL
jgi:hypothetical protein